MSTESVPPDAAKQPPREPGSNAAARPPPPADRGGERGNDGRRGTGAPGARPIYLGLGPDRVFALLHLPAERQSAGSATLLCPPFGWDDICSYRSRRAWAEALARAGHPALRLDLPGTGDSAGSARDPERLEAWTSAVSDAAGWLRHETGCARLTALGIGLGGLVAYAAAGRDSEIDDLILWAVPARGRTLVRELRAFSRLGHDPVLLSPPDVAPQVSEGFLEVGGFVMTAETIASLERLDLTKIELPRASARRVLLLERDGLAPDRRLREHLFSSGVDVSVAAGDNYGAMMVDPRLARPPRAVLSKTIAWLAAGPSEPVGRSRTDSRSGPAPKVDSSGTVELVGDRGVRVRETPLSLELSSGRLFAVLSEPVEGAVGDVCAVLLNAGGQRRIGPNRMWVEIARRWAARGVPTVRIDLRALGDSDGDERRYASIAELYRPELTEQTLEALDELEARALPNRFVLAGLCSGAYWSFQGALADERVAGAFMINLWLFFWSDALAAERDLRLARSLLRHSRGSGWTDRAESQWTARSVLRAGSRVLRTSTHQRRSVRTTRSHEIDLALDALRERGTEILLQFAGNEPLYGDLIRDGHIDRLDRWPNLRLEIMPAEGNTGEDHTFRALRLQHYVHASLDDALHRVRNRTPGP